jgi:hypothetical protein
MAHALIKNLRNNSAINEVYCFEKPKNWETFGVRLSWQPLSPTLLFFKLEGKAAPVPQHSKICRNYNNPDLCRHLV